jgi:hypothetical protein
MTRPSYSALLAACAVLSVGCDRGAAKSPDVIRTDSAGVRVVTSTSPDRDLTWKFEEIEVFRDSVGEPWIFEGLGPRRAVADRAGRTYVLTSEPSVARFGRDGRYERSFGRKGGAPGEMEFPTALVVQGDSLAVLDPIRGGLVRFGSNLEPINDLPFRDGLADVNAVAFRSGGLWVERRQFENGISTYALYADTITTTPMLSVAQPRAVAVEGCSGGGLRMAIVLPPFFSPSITWTTYTGRLLANLGPSYDLELYEGPRILARVRRDLPLRAPTEADVRRLYPEGLKVRFGNGNICTIEVAGLLESPGVAAEMPFVHGLALLSDGTIWVQRSGRNELPAILDVFTSDGAYAGTIRGMQLPLALLPNGELLVPREDEDSGGQHLVRMKVTR